MQRQGTAVEIELRDGLEQKLDLMELESPLRIHLNRDAFSGWQSVDVAKGRIRLRFKIESRDESSHITTVAIDGLTPGNYDVRVAHGRTEHLKFVGEGHLEQQVRFRHAGQVMELRLEGPLTS